MNTPTMKCAHNHTPEEIAFYGCEAAQPVSQEVATHDLVEPSETSEGWKESDGVTLGHIIQAAKTLAQKPHPTEALEDKEGKGWEVGLEAIRQEYHYMKSADRVNFNQLFYKLRTLLAQVAEESREKALEEAEAVVGNVRRFKEARFDSQPFFTGWNESLDVAQSDLAALKKN